MKEYDPDNITIEEYDPVHNWRIEPELWRLKKVEEYDPVHNWRIEPELWRRSKKVKEYDPVHNWRRDPRRRTWRK
jgi:hypothetical protein